jgi:hypothetical protein
MSGDLAGRGDRTAAKVGVGCFTAFVGFWSGGMIGVLIGKVVGAVQKCPSGDNGQPCNWQVYALVGMIVGLVSLPTIALWRMRSSRSAASNPE